MSRQLRQHERPGRCVRGVSAAMGLAAPRWPSVAAQDAHAGNYVMRNCSVPGYEVAPIGPWKPFEAPGND